MSSITTIEDLIAERGLSLAGPLVSSYDDEVRYYAFIYASNDKNGRRTPGPYVLNELSAQAKQMGYIVSFVLVDGDRHDLDGSLRTMLFGKFPEKIRNSFATFPRNKADVWVEPKRNLEQVERVEIQDAIEEFLHFLNIEVKSIHLTSAENIPTPTAILRAVRSIAPCTIKHLKCELEYRGFVVPNTIWMNRALDKLRKAGALVRSERSEYFLSFEALSLMGTRKNRTSPDILRALVLAKKRA